MASIEQMIQKEVARLVQEQLRPVVSELKNQIRLLKQAAKASPQKRRPGRPRKIQTLGVDGEVQKTRKPRAVTGKQIRALRKKLGLTQAQYAKLLGVSGQSIYKLENKDGVLRLRGTTRDRLAEARKMGKKDAAELLGLERPKPGPKPGKPRVAKAAPEEDAKVVTKKKVAKKPTAKKKAVKKAGKKAGRPRKKAK